MDEISTQEVKRLLIEVAQDFQAYATFLSGLPEVQPTEPVPFHIFAEAQALTTKALYTIITAIGLIVQEQKR